MPAQKYNIRTKSITAAIGGGTTTITHDLGRVARDVNFKEGGVDNVEFVWNDKGGSTTQIDVQNMGAPYAAIEINITAY